MTTFLYHQFHFFFIWLKILLFDQNLFSKYLLSHWRDIDYYKRTICLTLPSSVGCHNDHLSTLKPHSSNSKAWFGKIPTWIWSYGFQICFLTIILTIFRASLIYFICHYWGSNPAQKMEKLCNWKFYKD